MYYFIAVSLPSNPLIQRIMARKKECATSLNQSIQCMIQTIKSTYTNHCQMGVSTQTTVGYEGFIKINQLLFCSHALPLT